MQGAIQVWKSNGEKEQSVKTTGKCLPASLLASNPSVASSQTHPVKQHPLLGLAGRCLSICALAGAAALAFLVASAPRATAQNLLYLPAYNSIPSPLAGDYLSEGFECCQVAEIGDGMSLSGFSGTIGQVTVIFDSWACQSGSVYGGNCTTTPGATFSWPITFNIYQVNEVDASGGSNPSQAPTPGPLLASITQTFKIPYRPSSTPSQCWGNNQVWYYSADKTCHAGLAFPLTVDFSPKWLYIPANNKIIVTVAFNTSTYGAHPIGTAACSSTAAGCPYDSLNVSVQGAGGSGVIDPAGIFVNSPYTTCNPAFPSGLILQTPCWPGLHPQIQVNAIPFLL